MRSSRSAATGCLALAAAIVGSSVGLSAGCSSPVSYVVLTMQSSTPTPIDDVTDVEVRVMKGTALMKSLTYHHDAFRIDMVTNVTLSVSFTESQVGTVDFVVTARNAAACIVGTGTTTGAVIKKGARSDAAVSLTAANDCSQADGGVGDAGGDGRFPGCDPVTPACNAGQTCQVNCMLRLGQCVAGGTGAPGAPCQRNSDCMPGTQCFDYAATGCAVKVCLRFCDTAAQCPQPGDGGVGPGSMCAGEVQCNGAATAYHTCTFSCDPRQAAVTAGSTGCPSGLSCLALGSQDQVDCACPEATRTKQAGADCAGTSECAPGLICNMMGATQKCRPVCRCDAQAGTCTAGAGDCATGTSCSPLTNNTKYGVCL